jgi:hypothetical protein
LQGGQEYHPSYHLGDLEGMKCKNLQEARNKPSISFYTNQNGSVILDCGMSKKSSDFSIDRVIDFCIIFPLKHAIVFNLLHQ